MAIAIYGGWFKIKVLLLIRGAVEGIEKGAE
jgi:hypothetical protein